MGSDVNLRPGDVELFFWIPVTRARARSTDHYEWGVKGACNVLQKEKGQA